MINKICISIAAACFAFSVSATNEQGKVSKKPADISIGSMTIPFAYEKNGDGVYNQILDKLVEGYRGTIETNFLPANRLNRALETRKVDCTYITTAGIASNAPEGSPYRDLEFVGPVNIVSVVLYQQKEAPEITDLSQLSGMRVASDVNLVRLINHHGINEDFALQSQLKMIEMLVADRADVLIGYDFDLDFLSKQQGVRDQLKKANITLQTIGDGIACFNNEHNADFLRHIKRRFNEMSDSGWLDEALKDYR